MNFHKQRSDSRMGFTLIELLIVVAIIAILAAIAVPNFLEAQTRSKVSRVKSDLRTMATGIELYRVDYNKYPCSAADYVYCHAQCRLITYTTGDSLCLITSPIAYVTTIPKDVFNRQDRFVFPFDGSFFWTTEPTCDLTPPAGNDSPNMDFVPAGGWGIGSFGPNQSWDYVFGPTNNPTADPPINRMYDPTNGTVSLGDLLRVGPGGTGPGTL